MQECNAYRLSQAEIESAQARDVDRDGHAPRRQSSLTKLDLMTTEQYIAHYARNKKRMGRRAKKRALQTGGV